MKNKSRSQANIPTGTSFGRFETLVRTRGAIVPLLGQFAPEGTPCGRSWKEEVANLGSSEIFCSLWIKNDKNEK